MDKIKDNDLNKNKDEELSPVELNKSSYYDGKFFAGFH